MQINIPVHTVVTLVGSSNSGKTLLAYHLANQLDATHSNLNFHVVSSDDIRRELIGDDYLHKHSNEMLYASNSAFDLLFTKLKHLMSFPLSLKNAIIFVDTTGLSKEFRDQVNKLADEYSYNKAAIVLDYKEYQDFFKYADDSIDKSIISNHVTRLRTKALPQMRSKDYPAGIFRIKQPTEWWSDVSIELTNAEEYKDCWLPTKVDVVKYNISNQPYIDIVNVQYTVIGDVHSCYKELVEVIEKAGVDIINKQDIPTLHQVDKKVVLVGDFTDKNGKNVLATIDFLYHNKDQLYWVLGNHEAWIYGYLKGTIKDSEGLRFTYFDTAHLLSNDSPLDKLVVEEYKAKFFELVELSKPFLVHPDFICTHSPCKLKHLGKLDKESKRAQLKHRLPSIYSKDFATEEEYKVTLESNLGWLKEQAIANFPFIFSGHLSFSEVVRLGSQVMLDTGAVYGNKLTACTVKGRKLEFTQVQSKEAYHPVKYLTTIFDTQDKVDLYSLDPKEQKRVKRCLGNQPTIYFAPTMSPSASNESELEPIKTALEYYKSKGITDLVAQVKFMGNNAVFVWKPNPEDCYITSRNGFLINYIDISLIVNKLHPLVKEQFPDATMVGIAGEMLPWRSLGSGLIDNHFNPIYLGLKAELEFCKENKFDTAFGNLLSQAKEEFTTDRTKLSKSELRAKYGDAKVEWYTSVLQMAKYTNPVDIDLAEVEAYKTELDGYTQDSKLDFQPFQVLKIERGDKVEVLPFDNFEGFIMFNEHEPLQINLATCHGYETEVEHVKEVYKHWVANSQEIFGYPKLEGVVIKPLDPKLTNVAPYIKVRNPQYLKLVYGPTYNMEPTYSKLVKSKRTSRKIKSSISEWQLGLEMLSIHSSQMTLNNPKAVDLMIKFIAEEKKVEVLDPRL